MNPEKCINLGEHIKMSRMGQSNVVNSVLVRIRPNWDIQPKVKILLRPFFGSKTIFILELAASGKQTL